MNPPCSCRILELSAGANAPELPQLQDAEDLSFVPHVALTLTVMLVGEQTCVPFCCGILHAAQVGDRMEATWLLSLEPSSCSDPSQLYRLR